MTGQAGNTESRAAIGFTVKSGWASVVLLAGTSTSARAVDSRTIALSDPARPESRQPYHDGFGTARHAGPDLVRLLASVKQFGRRSVTGVIRDYRRSSYPLVGTGMVVGSLIDPARIANDHIRIHALEGQLFRGIVENAATRSRLSCSIWRDRDLYSVGVDELSLPEPLIRKRLAALGREVDGAWRAEQKAAALAAWLVLAARPPAYRSKS